jgi:hypothetical protein
MATVLSHVQTGFVYFDGERLAGEGRQLYTIDVMGTKGAMHMQGWDWGPGGSIARWKVKPYWKPSAKIPENIIGWRSQVCCRMPSDRQGKFDQA